MTQPEQPFVRQVPTVQMGAGDDTDVSIVIPHYEGHDDLDRTMAGVAAQRHPRGRTQVIVVDDGSAKPPQPSRWRGLDIDVTVLDQPDLGFRAGAARNLGAAAADGQVLVFLDADMIPDADLVGGHAAVHGTLDYVVGMGTRTHVDADDLSPDAVRHAVAATGTAGPAMRDRPTTTVGWRRALIAETNHLTDDDGRGWRLTDTGNLSMRRDFFHEIGGFDTRFWGWGGEDIELGWRAAGAGGLFVLAPGATAWHQGYAATTSPSERRSQAEQARFLGRLIADPVARRGLGPVYWDVPRTHVTIEGAATASSRVDALLAGVLRVLGDVTIHVLIDAECEVPRALDQGWREEPRVRFGPTDVGPLSGTPVHLHLMDVDVAPSDVAALAAGVTRNGPGGGMAELRRDGVVLGTAVRTGLRRRAERCGVTMAPGTTHWSVAAPDVLTAGASSASTDGDLDAGLQRLRTMFWNLPAPVRRTMLRAMAVRGGGG